MIPSQWEQGSGGFPHNGTVFHCVERENQRREAVERAARWPEEKAQWRL